MKLRSLVSRKERDHDIGPAGSSVPGPGLFGILSYSFQHASRLEDKGR